LRDRLAKELVMNDEQLAILVYEALETELGGVQVYESAIECALNEDLKKEWERYLEQTRRHVTVVEDLCLKLSLDPSKETAGRQVVRLKSEALVAAMQMAKGAGDPSAAEIVAAECVVDAETKDHQNWELLGEAADAVRGDAKRALIEACDAVEDEEDEHLYHTMGWARELRIEALGLPAVLPPPEEEKHVKTAIGAARAKQARLELL
jgi:rubrerythrin